MKCRKKWAYKTPCTLLASMSVMNCLHAETPLSLAASQSLTYDSNIMRDNANKYRDAVATTSVTLGFNKDYGRQSYRASLTGQTSKYKNTKELDNTGYDIQLGFTTALASNWNVTLDHYRQKQLQSFEQQSGARYPENIVSSVTQGIIQYGLYGRWSTNLTLGSSDADYQTINFYDRTSKYGKLGLRYSPTDLMYFDFGVRKTDANSPNYPILGGALIGDPVNRTDYELSSQWVVTGYSKLTARVGWTQERHSRDSNRDYDGLTGNVQWSYAPTGKTTFALALDRDTNNAGGDASELRGSTIDNGVTQPNQLLSGTYTSQNRLTTGLVFNIDHKATSKISLNTSLVFKRFREEERRLFDGVLVLGGPQVLSNSKNGNYKSFSVGANYQLHRTVALGCNIEKYERSASLFNREYDGEQMNCSVTLQLD